MISIKKCVFGVKNAKDTLFHCLTVIQVKLITLISYFDLPRNPFYRYNAIVNTLSGTM